MELQEILMLIQTGIGIVSLIVSLVTLNKVSKMKNEKSGNRQTAIGSRNKQKMK